MALPVALRAFRHDDFRRFFTAQLVAQIGSWMQTVAQSWLVLTLTSSPLLLGLIGTLQFGPILLFSIVSGALADRLPKKRLLIVTQAVLGGQALLLGALVYVGHVEYWHVAVLATGVGLANVLDGPARQSLVAEMVGRADVSSAISLNSACFNAARIVGPSIGGLVIARYGVAPAFLMNAVGFVIAIAMMSTLRSRGLPQPGSGGSVGQEILTGLRYVWRTREMVLALGLCFMVSFCVFNFTIYVPLVVRTVLGLGAEGFGFLMAALGVGAVSGALALGMAGPRPPRPLMFAAAALACGGLLGLSVVRSVWPAIAMLFLTGFFGVIAVVACNTTMQLASTDALRGRVMSIYTLVWGGVFPIGAFMVGAMSERWGVQRALATNGAIGLTGVAALLGWWRLRTR
ncbi:MAG TPA: MFS transporter [Methylomirabilota bacterium]|jgi:predicted MFS family arabinose efflux permease|nr:MFS transporter [Methylomirabilota bacterium]